MVIDRQIESIKGSIFANTAVGAGKQFRGFSLEVGTLTSSHLAPLPDEHELVINMQTGHYVVINWDVRYACVDGVFSKEELALAWTLLTAWPSYVTNEKLLYALMNRSASEIEDLLELGREETLQPLRALVTSCCEHFHAFGIEIQEIDGNGYKLSHYTPTREERQS
jgi:hypothetical protein